MRAYLQLARIRLGLEPGHYSVLRCGILGLLLITVLFLHLLRIALGLQPGHYSVLRCSILEL